MPLRRAGFRLRSSNDSAGVVSDTGALLVAACLEEDDSLLYS